MLLIFQGLDGIGPVILTVLGRLFLRYSDSGDRQRWQVFHSQEFVPCQGSEVSGVRFTGGRFASYRVRVPCQKLRLRRLAAP
jgi:hypothetical protein